MKLDATHMPMGVARDDFLPIETRQKTESHAISYIRGTGQRLVVSMSGVGKRRNFMPPWEFVATASNNGENHVLLVAEKSRSWMNSPDLPEAIAGEIESVVAAEGISDIVALGNSMGGFMALVLPQYTRVNGVIAISPQFSMHPDTISKDNRWLHWRERLPAFRHETIGHLDPDNTDYFIFHGDSDIEHAHWSCFPVNPKLHHFILRGEGHNLIISLKKSGLMRRVLTMAMNRRPRRVRELLEMKFDPIRREHLPDSDKHLQQGANQTTGENQ